MSILTSLHINNFRNYTSRQLEFDKGLVVIHGNNGAGKTNLLEAISLLSPGRGLRGARLEEMSYVSPSESRQPAASAGVWIASPRA